MELTTRWIGDFAWVSYQSRNRAQSEHPTKPAVQFPVDLISQSDIVSSHEQCRNGFIMTEDFEEIVEVFEFLDDWEDRYRHVIELGKAMASLDEAFQVPATKVDGCASQVWIVPRIEGQGPDGLFYFQGDSDAMIVRGLIAILGALYNNVSLKQVVDTDAVAAFARLGLDQHLSTQRSNGLRSMIAFIQNVARANMQGNV